MLTCRFIDGSEATKLLLAELSLLIAPRFVEESERIAAASVVAKTPEVTNECSAVDIAGVESVYNKNQNLRNSSHAIQNKLFFFQEKCPHITLWICLC